ncbi:MAG: hypothetical protein JSU63_03460 [Phycisphaerales bacterium]|nr:MAG: hypothetical protein JSU63_03460 [Phycisphaerales bacterium]
MPEYLSLDCRERAGRPSRVLLPMLLGLAGMGLSGCGGFLNPAFVELLDPTGQSTTVPNAAGHIVITFVDNAEVGERLLNYLEQEGGLILDPYEKRQLRPRTRMRVQVTFDNGSTSAFEFIDGSASLIDQTFDAQQFPDLNQNDLSNAVVACGAGVARIEVLPGSQIEVFVPVELVEWELRQVTNAAGDVTLEPNERQRFAPQFRALRQDDVDDDNNVLLRRNIDIRDMPVPVVNPVCGSVVAIVMNGALSVPFFQDAPGYDRDDEQTVAGIGGRFEFTVQSVE